MSYLQGKAEETVKAETTPKKEVAKAEAPASNAVCLSVVPPLCPCVYCSKRGRGVPQESLAPNRALLQPLLRARKSLYVFLYPSQHLKTPTYTCTCACVVLTDLLVASPQTWTPHNVLQGGLRRGIRRRGRRRRLPRPGRGGGG